jgi:HK97 family phage portal protein
MGLLSSLFERRDHPSRIGDHLAAAIGAGWDTHTGADVSPETSLQVAAVYACVRVIAESVAALPLITYQRLERGKARAGTHALYSLLHDAPNSEMTAMEFRETLTAHMALRGNAYAEIEYSNGGEVVGLWPLRPDKMKVERRNRRIVYDYTLPDQTRPVTLPAWRVLHLRGLAYDGLVGYGPIYLMKQAVALALGAEEFGARLFGNGTKPGVVLKHPGRLSAEAQDRLRKSTEDRHQGLSRAHRLMILEEGMDVASIGVVPEEAQFLETRKYQSVEIARAFRVPPHMIADLDRATFSNIEHQDLAFVKHSLRPWLVRWEQRISQSLLTAQERRSYFAEHLVDGLLRGDIQSRYTAYNTGIQAGFLTRNEVRERENLNPLDGLDEPLEPLNMVGAGSGRAGERGSGGAGERRSGRAGERRSGRAGERRSAEDVAQGRRRLVRSQVPTLTDAAGRVVRREVNDIRRAVQKFLVRANDLTGFLLWLGEFYEDHREFIGRQMGPNYESLALLVMDSVEDEIGEGLAEGERASVLEFVAEYVETLGTRWAIGNRNELESLTREGGDLTDVATRLEERLDGWQATEAEKTGRREAVRAVGAISLAVYRATALVARLLWSASGENCPYCDELNGRTVGKHEHFVAGGTELAPEGADGPLKVRRNTFHPPIHDGCDCVIVGG